ncbi:MAG: hypothetical protein MJ252_20345 [archaeon]|nr:hypothetical protein [archaeon]
MKRLLLIFALICSIFASDIEKINAFKICIAMKTNQCGRLPHCQELKDFYEDLKEENIKTIKELKTFVQPYKNNPDVKVCYDTCIR